MAAGLLFALMVARSGHDNILIGLAVVLLALMFVQAIAHRSRQSHAGPVPPAKLKVS